MTIEVDAKSRLNFCVARILDGIEAWDMLILPPIPVQNDDTVYEFVEGDKLTLLAYKFYGSSVMWWVLALANDIELPTVQVYPGLRLRVPSPRYVEQLLFRDAARRRRS